MQHPGGNCHPSFCHDSRGEGGDAHLVFVVRVAGLEQGLVDTAAASNDANHSAAVTADGLASARRQLDTRLARVRILPTG